VTSFKTAVLGIVTVGISVWQAQPASAQVIVGRGRGAIINLPGAGIRIGPLGGYGIYGGPRAIVVGPNGLVPGYGQTLYPGALDYSARPLRRLTARPRSSSEASPPNSASLPTEAELRNMDDASLLNAIVQASNRLDFDLGGFTSAASWRDYLRLPKDALPPANANRQVRLKMDSMHELYNRFESAAANAEYRQITGLSSYIATENALGELVRRFSGDAPAVASASPAEARNSLAASSASAPAHSREELPTPPPMLTAPSNEPKLQSPQNGQLPEHSILFK
jgi:hypothetical protein